VRQLRRDLVLADAPEGGALLTDPVTSRELELSRVQVVILRFVEAHASLDEAARAASRELGLDLSPDLLGELLDALDALALLEPAPAAAVIRARQREARQRDFREQRRAKLAAALEGWRRLPYYAEVLPSPAPEPASPDDVASLPVLDKATLRTRLADLLPPVVPEGHAIVWMSTSGTTGERQQFARSRADWHVAQTFTWALNRVIRAVLPAPHCKLTTPSCSGTECHLHEMSRAERTHGQKLVLESYPDMASLPRSRVERIARELLEHRPEYILADPTYLAILVDHARRLRLDLPRPRFVLSSYELLSLVHRRAIEAAFECPVYDAYGASEFGALAVQCELGRYHVNPESYILELLPHAGGAARMVVTTLDKQVMPLLRYDTGDLAIRAAEPCTCAWSETEVLASLEGRSADMIAAADGTPITAAAVDRSLAPAARGIVTYQLVQHGPAAYRLEVLPAEDHDEAVLGGLRDALHALLGAGARIRIERFREILPAPSGKFRLAHRVPGSVCSS
jgi:phenylacetate-CoA ligase